MSRIWLCLVLDSLSKSVTRTIDKYISTALFLYVNQDNAMANFSISIKSSD